MMNFAENFEEIVSAFVIHNVEFMIAGGYAVNLHGYERTTGDIDIWIKPVNANKQRVLDALVSLEFKIDDLQPLRELDFTKPFSFKVGDEPVDIDIFNAITGVKYEDAEKNMLQYKYSDSLTLNYIHLTELVVNKMLTGRPKDQLDVEQLQKIIKFRKG
jgi:hypothetical protein